MTWASTHVLIAPDKFKGSLTATQVASSIATGISKVAPRIQITRLPIADGGEGTLDAALGAGFERVPVVVDGPTGLRTASSFGIRDADAVIELALASGMMLLPNGRSDPLGATSRGTGELILAALDRGAESIILGVGGSASTDGGAGLIQALGGHLLDRFGRELDPGGGSLVGLHRVDLSELDPRLRTTALTLASDVDNPLLGPSGAAAVYGAQKGATSEQIDILETGLRRWAEVINPNFSELPGSGAAGGVGFALQAILNASWRAGASAVLELVDFDRHLAQAQLVITGEGQLDRQTMRGKAPSAVARAAKTKDIPVLAVCGRQIITEPELTKLGIRAVYPLSDLEPDIRRSMVDAGDLLVRTGEIIGHEWFD